MKKRHVQGFSILELLIVVAIVGIVMAIAVPNMRTFVQNERMTSFTNTLLSDMMLARSKAVERNQPVIICSSNNEANCTVTDYQDGWIDDDNDGAVTAADEIIKIQQAVTGELFFNLDDPALTIVIYDNRGFTPNSRGTFSICDERGEDHARSLTLSPTGRLSRGTKTQGVPPVC